MYGGLTEYVVLCSNLRHIKRFCDIYLLTVSAKSAFKVMNFGRVHFQNHFLKLLNNDDNKCKQNSTVN